jgi:hypothetical protein
LELKKKSLRNRHISQKRHEAFFCLSVSLMAKFGLIDLPMITTLPTSQKKKHCLTPNFNVGKVLYIFEKNDEHIVFIISNWFWWLTWNLFWVGSTGLECTALTRGPSPTYNL